MINEHMTDSDPMRSVIAKLQADAELAADNAAAAEEAENARIWPVPEGCCPFVPLGYNSSRDICCWSHAYRTVVSFRKLANTYGDVVQLAPIEQLTAWLNKTYNLSPLFPRWSECETSMRRRLVEMITEYVQTECARRRFCEERVRYSGVWPGPAGSVIYNSGRRHCYRFGADGAAEELSGCVSGKYIYDTRGSLGILPADTAMTDREGAQLSELIRLRPWQSPLSAELVVGWMACAVLSGIIPVRPQLWINAPAGTGKSNLQDDITAALGGDRGLLVKVDGRSTEAGIRRMLDRKALPLIFDEAEPDTAPGRPGGGKGRMESILELIRSVATEDSPSITQSALNGSVIIYKPLFCSILFSVDNGLERETDISRFIALNLTNRETRAEREARYNKQEPLKKMLRTPDFTPRFLRRVLERHAEILRNARALKRAIKATLTAAGAATVDRTAANMALLLAAGYSVAHSGKIPAELVSAYAEQAVLTDAERNVNTDRRSDAQRVLDALLTYREHKTGKTVTRLCRIAYERAADPEEIDAAECALEGLGLKIVRTKGGSEWLAIDTFSRGFREIFTDCDISAKSVRSALKNDPDGIAVMRYVKFSGKVSKEAPSLPLEYILGTDENM